MSKRVLIVGAGPGGLAAAILLARAGLRVKVVEKQPRVGGRTSTVQGGGGYKFDLGPTFFLYPRILQEIFAAAGRNLFNAVPMVRLDPQYSLVFESGGRIDATPDVSRMKRQIASIAPEDAGAFEKFLTENRGKLAAFEPVLQSPFNGLRDVMNLRMLKMLPTLRPWLSLDGELKRHFTDSRIRLAFSFQAKYLGMSPYRCPGLFSILSFLEYEHGVYHPIGGCGAVSDAMADLARDLGAEISLDDPVEQVLFEGKRAVGVKTRAGETRADAVVINADFAKAMHQMVPDRLRRKWTDARIAKKKFSCSTFMMYLGLKGTCPELAHHTIFLAQDYKKNLAEIEKTHTLSANPSFYVQNPCTTDRTMAPRGDSSLYMLLPVSHQHENIDWGRQRAAFRALAFKQLEKLGLKGVERRVVFEKVVTPDDWEGTYDVYRGATFNLAHNFNQMLHLRPQNRFRDVDGVYLVGGGRTRGAGCR